MKIIAALLAACVAVATAANTEPAQLDVVVGEPTTSPVPPPTPSMTAQNQTASHGKQAKEFQHICFQPRGAVFSWYRVNKNDGPHFCTRSPLDREWAMMRSYRDGGIEGVHWKFTDNPNDNECMEDWIYHAGDGRTVKTRVSGRTTTYGLNRRWCGLPVYHHGGVEGYQWIYCNCKSRDNSPPSDRK